MIPTPEVQQALERLARVKAIGTSSYGRTFRAKLMDVYEQQTGDDAEDAMANDERLVADDYPRLLAACQRAEAERDKLQAFKDWVHRYLDCHGVPHHPPGTHGAEGCRIGDRLDWLMAERERLQAELDKWRPLTPEEAQKSFDEAEAVPLSPEEIARIVARITDPVEMLDNSERAQLLVAVPRLQAENARLREQLGECWATLGAFAKSPTMAPLEDVRAGVAAMLRKHGQGE